ncbi:type II toxin-antitoxin system RelE/ParE family toxin [Candidatus Kaiserbacteria bacterium]|nr:type II toxin-antitoxin system RelE/ParE family toxin [Candidatus Kaiserbacteria bacterium]
MLDLDLKPRATKFMRRLPPKHKRQIGDKIFALRFDPTPPDSAKMTGFAYRRADIGEYRIIYRVEGPKLLIPLVGKRNDDEVYRQLKRLEG